MIEFDYENGGQLAPSAAIKVIGVGGAGGNVINSMISASYQNVEFVVANTDAQALRQSQALLKLQLGSKSTKGLGTGANPELGKRAAEEDLDKIAEVLHGADVVFLIGGLGGGTGSGALPVIARAAKERGILTIAVVTKPFEFEGKRRSAVAQQALEAVKKDVDTLIVIPNQKLLELSDANVSLVDAFGKINQTINQFVKSIADIIARPGHINVDFADVRAIMRDMGLAVMGTASASGKDRAEVAARNAISSNLLENMSIDGARGILLNICGSTTLKLQEVSSAAEIVYAQAHEDASIILGSVIDDSMGDEVSVTVIATGFAPTIQPAVQAAQNVVPQPVPVMQPQSYVQPVLMPTPQPVPAPVVMPVPVQHVQQPQAQPVQVQSVPAPQSTPSMPKDAATVTQSVSQDLEIPALLRRMAQEKQQPR